MFTEMFWLLTIPLLVSIALLFVGVAKKNKLALVLSVIFFFIFLGIILFTTKSEMPKGS